MKQGVFCVAIVVSLTVVAEMDFEQNDPSFLKFIGSYKYNTTETGQITLKRLYVSHYITNKWIDSFMTCKSVGMQLAFFETGDEIKNFASIVRKYPHLFKEKVFIDGRNLVYDPSKEVEPCYSVQQASRRKLEIKTEDCNSESRKFLCEDFEVVGSYDESNLNSDMIDVKSTFFTYLGDFETLNVKKSYYISLKHEAPSNNVPKICQSFDMRIASPSHQAEYDHLRKLLQNITTSTYRWNSAIIAGYRSEEKDLDWVTFNNKVNYKMDWVNGVADNFVDEHCCIAIQNSYVFSSGTEIPKISGISCSSQHQFICELDASVTSEKKFNEIGLSRFFKAFANYNYGAHTKDLFLSTYDVDWISALFACKNFGMELLTPSSIEEDEILRKILENADVPNTLHVGASSVGTKEKWYQVHTGKAFNYDLEWIPESNSCGSDCKCLLLRNFFKNKFTYDTVKCFDGSRSRFICQKVT